VDDAEIYFVSNQEDRPLDLTASFRAGKLAPELWDPATGETRELPGFSAKGDVVELPLHLDAYGSAFLVFRGNRKPTAGKNHLEFKTVLNIKKPWTVNFPPNLGAPETAVFKDLGSWTEHSESGIRFFSGTAAYQTDFEYNAPKSDRGSQPVYLDLGKVAEMAEVELNGKNLGVLWKPPFRVRIDEALKTGKNTLVIKVTNLWRNRMIGDESLPQDDVEWPEFRADKKKPPENWPEWLLQGKPRPSGRVVFCTQKDVYSTDDALVESGLLGPVTLQIPQGK